MSDPNATQPLYDATGPAGQMGRAQSAEPDLNEQAEKLLEGLEKTRNATEALTIARDLALRIGALEKRLNVVDGRGPGALATLQDRVDSLEADLMGLTKRTGDEADAWRGRMEALVYEVDDKLASFRDWCVTPNAGERDAEQEARNRAARDLMDAVPQWVMPAGRAAGTGRAAGDRDVAQREAGRLTSADRARQWAADVVKDAPTRLSAIERILLGPDGETAAQDRAGSTLRTEARGRHTPDVSAVEDHFIDCPCPECHGADLLNTGRSARNPGVLPHQTQDVVVGDGDVRHEPRRWLLEVFGAGTAETVRWPAEAVKWAGDVVLPGKVWTVDESVITGADVEAFALGYERPSPDCSGVQGHQIEPQTVSADTAMASFEPHDPPLAEYMAHVERRERRCEP